MLGKFRKIPLGDTYEEKINLNALCRVEVERDQAHVETRQISHASAKQSIEN
jgi:hypothetical protein